MSNDNPNSQEAAGDRPDAICSRWFRDPEGDLLRRGEVENIWIESVGGGLFRRKTYCVRLQWHGSSSYDWEWLASNRELAEMVRDRLILVLCEN